MDEIREKLDALIGQEVAVGWDFDVWVITGILNATGDDPEFGVLNFRADAYYVYTMNVVVHFTVDEVKSVGPARLADQAIWLKCKLEV